MLCIPACILSIEDESDRAYVLRLFQQYSDLWLKVAYKVVLDSQIAQDMVQDSCITIIKQLQKIKQIDCCKLQSYLVSIVRNTSISYVVKRNRQSRFRFYTDDASAFDSADSSADIDEAILRDTEIKALRDALAKLPEREKALLEMKYFDQLSDSQIAEIFDIKAASVRIYLTRARRHLADLLKGVI